LLLVVWLVLAAGCWLLAAGCWLLAAGRWPLACLLACFANFLLAACLLCQLPAGCLLLFVVFCFSFPL
jgi:E3 ubiquitin-protein ligase RNF183